MSDQDPQEPKRRRGRPRCIVPVEELDLLTIPQVLAYLRTKHRPLSRKRIREQIILGALPASLDLFHHDNQGQPIYRVKRADVDRMIRASLQPLRVTRIA